MVTKILRVSIWGFFNFLSLFIEFLCNIFGPVMHTVTNFKLIILTLYVQTVTSDNSIYPDLKCHPGYDEGRAKTSNKENLDECDWHNSEICYQHCVFEQTGLIDNEGVLQRSDSFTTTLATSFFSDSKFARPIADKVIFECQSKWKQIRNKMDCGSYLEFALCVDSVWMCRPGVPSQFAVKGGEGPPAKKAPTIIMMPAKGSSSNSTSSGWNTKPAPAPVTTTATPPKWNDYSLFKLPPMNDSANPFKFPFGSASKDTSEKNDTDSSKRKPGSPWDPNFW